MNHIRTFSKNLLALFMVLFLLSACSSNGIKGVAEAPGVSVEGVKVDYMSIMGGQATVMLNVSNPNTFAIPLNGFDYSLKLNGIQVANGREKGNMSIDGRGNRQINVPVKLSLLELIRFAPQLLSKKGLTYELAGSAHFPLVNVPFRRTGGVVR